MIDINSIIHIQNEAFDIDKHTAVLCLENYKKQVGAFEFQKDNIYSIEFAKSVGTVINNFTLTCTNQKNAFQIITKAEIKTPTVTLKEIEKQALESETQEIQETKYRFEKNKKPFKKGDIVGEKEIVEAGLIINELFENETLTWLK